MSQGVRVIRPDRAQLRWDMVDLDSQLPDGHRVRVVWAFVQGLDLAEILQPDQGTRRGCRAAGERSRSGIGSLALCERGGDWFGAGDRSVVPAACRLSLAVRRSADQLRSAGGVSPRECVPGVLA